MATIPVSLSDNPSHAYDVSWKKKKMIAFTSACMVYDFPSFSRREKTPHRIDDHFKHKLIDGKQKTMCDSSIVSLQLRAVQLTYC